MKPIVKKLIGQVIVSCQAYEDTPLFGSEYMVKMAESALLGGSKGIRACWPNDIREIRKLGNFPIIGINKIWDPAYEGIFITPTYESAVEIIEAGCDVVAIDCSISKSRTKEQLASLLRKIRSNYPEIAIMADCASYEECEFLDKNGLVDILSTTLSRAGHENNEPDIELVKRIKKNLLLPVNAEGRIWELSHLEQVIQAGADMITIGTAITRPHEITKRFVIANNQYRGLD